uniref:Uncharacterized protein n=1 Tax=Setaria italica TaxID=4555 RepID=K3YF67_SETIT
MPPPSDAGGAWEAGAARPPVTNQWPVSYLIMFNLLFG